MELIESPSVFAADVRNANRRVGLHKPVRGVTLFEWPSIAGDRFANDWSANQRIVEATAFVRDLVFVLLDIGPFYAQVECAALGRADLGVGQGFP